MKTEGLADREYDAVGVADLRYWLTYSSDEKRSKREAESNGLDREQRSAARLAEIDARYYAGRASTGGVVEAQAADAEARSPRCANRQPSAG